MIVISCFDYSTNFVKPWAEAGYTCYCVDCQHSLGEVREGNIVKVGANVLDWLPPREKIAFAAFFPECTDVAVSGARWFKDKGIGALIKALRQFEASIRLAQWTGAPYFIENPVSVVSTYWRKPDYIFNPCDYSGYLSSDKADAYTKKTCLWTGGGFVMPETKSVKPIRSCPQGSWLQKLGGKSKHTKNLRSQTPMGFARAVFEANSVTPQEALYG